MNNLFWIYIFLFFLLIIGIRFAKLNSFFEDYLSLDTMKYLQGFSVIGIIVHHLVQKLTSFGQTESILGVFNNLGSNFVGLFLFCSGFGLYKSFKTKTNYLNGFFKNRFSVVLIPFYLITILYFAIHLLEGSKYTLLNGVLSVLGIRLVNGDFWFVIAILFFYSFFYLCFRFIKKEGLAILSLAVLLLSYIVVCILRLHGDGMNWLQGEWWCNSTMLFLVGILWAKFEPQITSFIQKLYWLFLPLSLILSISLQKLTTYALSNFGYWSETQDSPGYLEKFQCLGIQTLSITAFVFAIIILSMKIKVGNRALKYIGALTLEIYLLQRLFILYFSPLESNYVMYTIAVICATVITASGIHQISIYLKNKLFKL